MIRRQYTLYLENKPGMLAMVTEALAKNHVDIEGISVAESTDTALVQIVVDHAARAEKALTTAKIPHTSQDVSVIVLDHQPGVLASLTSKLLKAGVNINYIYATAVPGCDKSGVVISADDQNKVEKVAAGKR